MDPQRRFFDERAARWEEECYPPPTRARLEAFLPAWEIRPNSLVLDVGTGPGILLPYLHAAGCKVTAIDISAPMLRQAARKGSACGLVQADAHALPFASQSFHHVICFAAFPHFANPQIAAQECARILKPGGTLVIAHLLSRAELAQHHGRHNAVAEDILPDAPAMTRLLAAAGLTLMDLVDQPGRYLARARPCLPPLP